MHFTAIVNGASIKGTWEWSPNPAPGDGKTRTIEAHVGDRTYTIEVVAVEAQTYWVKWNDRSFDVTVAEDAAGLMVNLGRHRIPVTLDGDRPQPVRSSASNAAKRHDGKVELRAPMPGKIVRTLVAKGDAVQANQGLVVMEAMKMQNEIKTPKAGVVTSLTVTEGTPVNTGDLLATVE